MTRPVYSQDFIQSAAQTAGTVNYTVPTGYVMSLRGMTAYKSTAATACSVYAAITDVTNTFNTVIWIANLLSVTTVQSEVWNGMVVAQPGCKLVFGRLSAGGTWFVSASGFLLKTP